MRVGEQVRCVKATGSCGLLREGQTYTVSGHGICGCIYVEGVKRLHPGWSRMRFRRIVRTDITLFQELLTHPIPRLKEATYGQNPQRKVLA